MSEDRHRPHESGLVEEVDEDEKSPEREHLDGVETGAGCAEIWEHLSEQREQAGSD